MVMFVPCFNQIIPQNSKAFSVCLFSLRPGGSQAERAMGMGWAGLGGGDLGG